MTLIGRAPRSVYRVYDEDDYTCGPAGEPSAPAAPGEHLSEPSAPAFDGPGERLLPRAAGARRPRRAAGVALLAAVLGAGGGLLVLDGVRMRSSAPPLAVGTAAAPTVHSARTGPAVARGAGRVGRVKHTARAHRHRSGPVRPVGSITVAHVAQAGPPVASAPGAEFGFER